MVECDGINAENTEKPKFQNNIVYKSSDFLEKLAGF